MCVGISIAIILGAFLIQNELRADYFWVYMTPVDQLDWLTHQKVTTVIKIIKALSNRHSL